MPATDVDQVADRGRDSELDERSVQRAVFGSTTIRLVDAGAAQAPQRLDVLREAGVFRGNQRQQFAPQRCLPPSLTQPVVNEMAVAKALEQTHVAKLFQVLGNSRLAQPEDPRQFGHAALALVAKRHYA